MKKNEKDKRASEIDIRVNSKRKEKRRKKRRASKS